MQLEIFFHYHFKQREKKERFHIAVALQLLHMFSFPLRDASVYSPVEFGSGLEINEKNM